MDPSTKTRLPSIANLMSPPESKALDSFRPTPSKSPSTSYKREYTPEDKLPPLRNKMADTSDHKIRAPISPPISPWQERQKHQGQSPPDHHRTLNDLKDPPLYPDSEASSTYEEPLFHTKPLEPSDALMNQHIEKHLAQIKEKFTPPQRDEYKLALGFFTRIGAQYNKNPVAYAKRQREEQDDIYHQTKRICAGPGVKPGPVPILPAPKASKRAIPATPLKPKTQRVRRTPKTSPRGKLLEYQTKGRAGTPKREPGQKKVEDNDFNSIKDYSPPPETSKDKTWRTVQWTSQGPLDLTNDPDRDRLRDNEYNLAAKLRLTCAQYLTQKRRIFQARVKALQRNKEGFRKTDAQQACKIDVNKASALWTAYDEVHWFDKHYFEQYRNEVIE